MDHILLGFKFGLGKSVVGNHFLRDVDVGQHGEDVSLDRADEE
jgi:hypothetical protein